MGDTLVLDNELLRRVITSQQLRQAIPALGRLRWTEGLGCNNCNQNEEQQKVITEARRVLAQLPADQQRALKTFFAAKKIKVVYKNNSGNGSYVEF